ncbi:hypothetical protein DACRYDRAFT_19275, partial [Dacryopinax primogenitus]
MAVPCLSTGCIEEMVTVSLASDTSPVILQLLECSKELNAEGDTFDPPYFILTLSDGASFITKVVLHSSVVPRLCNEEIKVYDVITLMSYESCILMPIAFPGWANIISDWQAYCHSLGYATAPYEFHYVWPQLPQAAPPPLMTQITMMGVGVVPSEYVALMLPVLPPPPVPIPTQVDHLLPINASLDHTALHIMQGTLPMFRDHSAACASANHTPCVGNNSFHCAHSNGANIPSWDKGTIDILCHDLTGKIDLVVHHPVHAKFASVEVGKVYTIFNLDAIVAVQEYCCSFHTSQLDFHHQQSDIAEVPDDGTIPELHFSICQIIQIPELPDKKCIGLHSIFDCEMCDQNYMAPVA